MPTREYFTAPSIKYWYRSVDSSGRFLYVNPDTLKFVNGAGIYGEPLDNVVKFVDEEFECDDSAALDEFFEELDVLSPVRAHK